MSATNGQTEDASRALRVAMIVSRFPLVSETFVLEQVTGLLDRGHDVEIYALDGPGDELLHPAVGRRGLLDHTSFPVARPRGLARRLALRAELAARTVRRSPRVGLRTLGCALRPRRAPTLRSLDLALPRLASGAYDVVHCQFASLGRRALALRRVGALVGPLVVSVRGYDMSAYVQKNGAHVYAPLFAAADLLLPSSVYFRERIVELGCRRERTRVQPSGVDLERFRFRPPAATGPTWRCLSVGRLVEKKGFDDAIRAVGRLVRRGHDVRYTILGDGPLRGALEALGVSEGVADRVDMPGAVTRDAILDGLRAADVLLAPSVTAGNGDTEGGPNSIKEAMAAGVPVVATRHGGIPEMFDDLEELVDERDPGGIAERIARLLADPAHAATVARAARARMERGFDSNLWADRLVGHYREAMA